MTKTRWLYEIEHTFYAEYLAFENRAVYEIMWKKNVVPQMTIWRLRIACCIPKATNTHSKYVILIADPLQQWLRERASMLCYAYRTEQYSTVQYTTVQYSTVQYSTVQ